MKYRLGTAAAALVATFGGSAAEAQLTLPLLQPVIPFVYSRGRNVSVTERDRPEYQAVGIPAGGFTIYPKIDVEAGYTSNVFETNVEKRSAPFFNINPDVRAQSNWSRNSLSFDAGANLTRYTKYSIRDESGWHVAANGQLQIGSNSTIDVIASTGRQYETRFSGSTPADIASATPYQLTDGQVHYTNNFGRLRFIAVGDATNASFKPITLLTGEKVNQNFRSRDVYTGTGQLDYALTPDVSVFAQVGYSRSDYYTSQATGLNDRTSDQVRGLAGISLDLTALVRGSFGIGYVSRDYRSNLYRKVSGLAMEARLEYFVNNLTTFTLQGRRSIEDASIAGVSGYFNTGVGLRVDHEVLRNFLVNAGIDYESDTYRNIDAKAKIFVVSAGGRYLLSRTVGLGLNGSYGRRHGDEITGPIFNEAVGLFSVYLQR